MTRNNSSQAGSAFFIILIAISLFAALSYAVSRSNRSSTVMLNKDQARIAATEILAQIEVIRKTTQTLRLRGCSDTQLNYSSSYDSSQTNPLAPADKSCDIFDMNGGKAVYQLVNKDWQRPGTPYPYWYFNGQTAVFEIGTNQPELLLWVFNIKSEICAEFNKQVLGSPTTALEIVGPHTGGFNGTYNLVANGIGDDVANSIYAGKSMGCDINGSIYAVMIAR